LSNLFKREPPVFDSGFEANELEDESRRCHDIMVVKLDKNGHIDSFPHRSESQEQGYGEGVGFNTAKLLNSTENMFLEVASG